MRRRVASFCAALLFITYSIICGPTYASGIWTVDGNVDPWADLEELEGGDGVEAQAVEEDGGEEESIFDCLDESDFFGFSAVTSEGLVEDALLFGDYSALFSPISSFSANWLSSATFYFRVYNMNGYLLQNYSGNSSTVPFSVFGSNKYPWLLQFTNAYGSTTNCQYGWFCSTSSMSMFVDFTELQGADLDSITLHGSLLSSIQGYVSVQGYSEEQRGFRDCYMSSCQLIAYVSGSDIPIILGAYDVNTGSVSFRSKTFDVNRVVERIGLRIIFNNLPTSDNYTVLPSASGSLAVRLRFSHSAFAGDYEGAKTEGEITNGLLSGLIEIVTGIYNSVVSIPGNLQAIISNIGNILTSITELPGKLWTLISDGLQSLFIPTEEQLQEISDKYDGLFEEKLGFVYQLFSFVVDTFGKLKDTLVAADNYSFHFPGISFPMNGEIMEIIPEQDVSLDNAVMDVLRPVFGTIVTIVCVLAVVSLGFDMVVAILSGKSYSQFIGEKREDLDI